MGFKLKAREQLHASYSSRHTPLGEVLRARTQRLDLQRRRLDALRELYFSIIRGWFARRGGSHAYIKRNRAPKLKIQTVEAEETASNKPWLRSDEFRSSRKSAP